MLQRDSKQWKIRKQIFIFGKQLYKKGITARNILKNWVKSLDMERIALFVKKLYDLTQSSKVKRGWKLLQKPLKTVRRVQRTYQKVDRIRRSDFWKRIVKFGQAFPTGILSGKSRR